jgi:hypothetical protein
VPTSISILTAGRGTCARTALLVRTAWRAGDQSRVLLATGGLRNLAWILGISSARCVSHNARQQLTPNYLQRCAELSSSRAAAHARVAQHVPFFVAQHQRDGRHRRFPEGRAAASSRQGSWYALLVFSFASLKRVRRSTERDVDTSRYPVQSRPIRLRAVGGRPMSPSPVLACFLNSLDASGATFVCVLQVPPPSARPSPRRKQSTCAHLSATTVVILAYVRGLLTR